jgi:hypothetical protein
MPITMAASHLVGYFSRVFNPEEKPAGIFFPKKNVPCIERAPPFIGKIP